MSDADGRIVIPARALSRNNPLRAIVGPDIVMFKAGYGRWRFRADSPRPLLEEPSVLQRRAKQGWQHFATDGAVVELPRLETREERLRAMPESLPGGADMPADRIPRWRAAYNQERINLAAIEIPGSVDSATRTTIKQAIDECFVFGFRRVMFVGAALALASSLIAFVLIRSR